LEQPSRKALIGFEFLRHPLLPALVDYFRNRIREATFCILVDKAIWDIESESSSFLPDCLHSAKIIEVIDPDGSGLIIPHIKQFEIRAYARIRDNLPDTVKRRAPLKNKQLHFCHDFPYATEMIRTLEKLRQHLTTAKTKQEMTIQQLKRLTRKPES